MKKVLAVILAIVMMVGLIGCTEASRVSSNISKEADNFNVVRELTVMNDMTGQITLMATGYLSIRVDENENQLEITCKEIDDNGSISYKKHFAGFSMHTSYTLTDITGSDVNPNKFTLNFNPDMLMPFDVKNYSENH